MPSQFLDPTGDVGTATWALSTGTTVWSLLDDGVRQPTAPAAGSDRLLSSTNGQIAEVAFPDTPITGTPTRATLWMYGQCGLTGSQTVTVELRTGSTGRNGTLLASVSANTSGFSWWSCTWDKGSPITQAEVNGLTAVFVSNETVGTSNNNAVAATYVELIDLSAPLAGTIAAAAVAVGDLSVAALIALSAATAAQSVTAAALTVTGSPAGIVAAQSSTTAAATIQRPLVGQATAASTTTGTASVYRPLVAAVAAQSTVTGALSFSARRWDVTPAARWGTATTPRWAPSPGRQWGTTTAPRWGPSSSRRWDLAR